jgi:hypothetical protein
MKKNLPLIVGVVSGVAIYAATSYFDLSLLWMLLTFVPVAYVQIYLTNRYNFRDSVRMEPVPSGNGFRVLRLDDNQEKLAGFGFTKIDEFYLDLAPDVIAYVYRSEQHPITLLDYNVKIMTFVDLVTRFDNGWMLNTSDTKHAGASPVPENKLLQVFPYASFPDVLKAHLDAVEFLKQRGFQPSAVQSENYREAFMEHYRRDGKFATGILSPVKIVYRAVTGKKKRHFMPVQQQVIEKLVKLP